MSIEKRWTRAGEARYVARVKSNGRLVATRTFRRKRDAEAWEHIHYRALAFGEFVPPLDRGVSFAEVAARFLDSRRSQIRPHSWRTDRDNLAAVPRWFAALPISSVGPAEVLAYLTELLAARARSTVQRARGTLGAVFSYAIRERMLIRNPVQEVRVPPGGGRASRGIDTFTEGQLAATLAAQYRLAPRLAAVTEFLSLTGLRWSELRALRIGDVRPAPVPGVRIWRAQSDGYPERATKSGSTRTVPLTDRAHTLTILLAEDRPIDDYLVVTTKGRHIQGNGFRYAVRWSETAPPDRTVHDLRHYAASAWLRAGIPVHQVARWLGHANPAVTLNTYAHILGEAQDVAAIAQLNARSAPGRPR